MIQFVSCVIIFSILPSLINADDPCSFKDSTGRIIDISSLSNTDGKAKFADLTPTQSSTDWKYSFNPCKPFSEGTVCINVAVCQVSLSGDYTIILGKQDNAKWDSGASTGTSPTLLYSYDTDTGQKNVLIEMICEEDEPGSVQALGEVQPNNYQFRLSSKCACWDGCKGQGPPSGGPGGFPIGAIFIIILVALAVIYLTVFALYSRFRLHQSGRDLIAHRTFWVAVPVYAKDGVLYLVRRATGKGGQYNSV